jgi:proline dehydrogenase
MRSLLLAGSENLWLRERAPRFWPIRRAVSRFMPGEDLEDALAAVGELRTKLSVGAVLTHLGENIADSGEASRVSRHYVDVLARVRQLGLDAEVSVKLTQLGLDLSKELCFESLAAIVEHERQDRVVWIDMEASQYVDATLEIYRRARHSYPNVGVCLQAYLYRTGADLAAILPLSPAIRLVKGAYNEPVDRAFAQKQDVDENYFELAKTVTGDLARQGGVRAAFGTHDRKLIARIMGLAGSNGLSRNHLEFQMLYGIQRAEQLRLARQGIKLRVLISYGTYWFPWFMRRLAERPANTMFVVRNLFAR